MAFLLLAVPLLTAFSCWLIGSNRLIFWFNSLGAVITCILSLLLAQEVLTAKPLIIANGWLYLDALSVYLLIIIGLVGLIAALYSVSYLQQEIAAGLVLPQQLGKFYLLLHFFIFTMFLTVAANNLGLMWIGIEATTLASALLVSFYNKKTSLEAGWKYIILCTVGLTFALLGIILIYYTGSQVMGATAASLQLTNLMAEAQELDPKLLKLAFIFILVGFGTKAGLAPLHNWLPDAHSQAPSPVSALLSGVLLNCALYGILRCHLLFQQLPGEAFSGNLLLIFGLFSMAMAVPFIALQHDLKRLLAYSSIEHMGIIAVGIGLGGRLGLFGATLHIFNHAMAKSLLFFAAGNITQHYGTKQIGRIKGAFTALPVSGLMFFLGFLAITGIPSFSIFVSEFSIAGAGFAQKNFLVGTLFILFITLIFAGFSFHSLQMLFGHQPARTIVRQENWLTVIAMGIPVILIALFGLYLPDFFQEMLAQVVQVFEGEI